jgi:hypothetical protein
MPAHILLTPRLVLRIMNACVAYVTAMGILTWDESTRILVDAPNG